MKHLIIQDNLFKSHDLSLYEYNEELKEVKAIIENTYTLDIIGKIQQYEYDNIWIEKSMTCNFIKNIMKNDFGLKANWNSEADHFIDINKRNTYIGYWIYELGCKLL